MLPGYRLTTVRSFPTSFVDCSDEALRIVGGYTVKTLLTTFGRGCDTKLPDVETMSWEELFRMNNQKLSKVGMEPTERRYAFQL